MTGRLLLLTFLLVLASANLPIKHIFPSEAKCSAAQINAECSGNALCAAEHCSHCIMRTSINPYTTYCEQLSLCTCRAVPDASCFTAVEFLCT